MRNNAELANMQSLSPETIVEFSKPPALVGGGEIWMEAGGAWKSVAGWGSVQWIRFRWATGGNGGLSFCYAKANCAGRVSSGRVQSAPDEPPNEKRRLLD